jgi:serine/threonine protein kinase
MELITGGELFDKIVSVKRFDEKTARRYFQQLIDGIAYCHTNKIAHRDLKPENLLLDNHDQLKISDFGLSGIMQTTTVMLSTICGTPHYVAPEVLTGNYNGMIADIWSCGIILFVMISGCHPFDGDTVQELFKRIENLGMFFMFY